MIEIFNIFIQKKITPNQFYLLYSLKENVSPVGINLHVELRVLINDGWITHLERVTLPRYELTPLSIDLIQQVETLFKTQKKKNNIQVLGDNYTENIEKYLLIFPKIKLPSGKPARTDKRNVETAFKWFFENHDYTWEVIFESTERYVAEFEKKNYLYMQTSQYFIRKQQSDKTWGSELANWCSTVNNGTLDNDTFFHEKVV